VKPIKETKNEKKFCVFIVLSVIFSLVSTMPILLCMFNFSDETKQLFSVILSTLFWGGLIAEQVFIWLADRLRKQELPKNLKSKKRQRVGIASFCETKVGIATDVVFVISLMIYIVLFVGDWGVLVVQYVCLFLIVLSFRVHCIANGKNYRYILYLQKRREK